MVDVVSKIKLFFVAQGAPQAAKATESVGRAQTRLGQASASTGRQFSAQASGLGGLVSAYAGAAATIFAVTMAFNALSKAAQAEQVIKGTKALALEVGASGDQIIASIQKITKGQLSMAEAATSANIALSAGFGQEQIERLTLVSLKASRALGRSLTDAFTRLTRGTAKLEPELLDELGIFVRIEPAVEKYAVTIGKTASALTQFERRQAFVNATIEEGERKFGIIDTSAESTLESFEKLSATFQDLIRTFGGFAADVIAPLIRFFSAGGNAMLLFLGVGRLVFGKAGQLLGGFSQKVTKDIGRFTDKMTAASERTRDFGKATAQAQQQAKGLKHTFAGLGPVGGAKATEARQARGRAQAGAQLSTRQMQADIKTLKGVDAAETQHRKSLDAKSDAYKRSSERGAAASKIAGTYKTAIKSAGIQTRVFAGFANLASLAVKGLTIALRTLMSVFNILFMVVGAAQLIGSFFDVDILGGITGWFKELGAEARNLQKAFEGIINAASLDEGIKESLSKRFTSNEIRRIAEDATDIIPEITEALQDVTIGSGVVQPLTQLRGKPSVRDLGGVENLPPGLRANLEKFGKQFVGAESNFNQVNKGFQSMDTQAALTMKNIVRGFSSLYREGEEAITGLADKVNAGIGSTALQFKDLGENFDGVRTQMQYIGEDSNVMRMRTLGLAAAYSQIADQQSDYQEAQRKWESTEAQDETGRAEQSRIMKSAKMRMESLRLYIAAAESGRIEVGKMGVALSNLTGVPLTRVIDELSEMGGVVTRVKDDLFFAGEAIARFNEGTQQFDTTPAMEKLGAFIGINIRFVDLQKRVREAYDKGAISAESMSQKVGGLSALVREATLDITEQATAMVIAGATIWEMEQAIAGMQKRLTELTEKRDALQELADGLSRVENIGKNLRRVFSKEIKLFDDAAIEGLVTRGEDGALKWAESSAEIAKNQRDYLKSQFTSVGLSKETLDFVGQHRTGQEALNQADKAGLDVNSLIRKEIENSQTALKAMVGSVPRLTQQLVKVKEEIEKITIKLKGVGKVLTLKNELTVLKGGLDTLNKKAVLNQKMNAASLKYEKELLKAQKQNAAKFEKYIDFYKEHLEIQKKIADVGKEIAAAGLVSLRATAERGGAARVGAAQMELAELERDSALHTAEEIRQKKEEVINIEYSNAMNILKIEKMQAEAEYTEKLALINMEKAGLVREQRYLATLIASRNAAELTQMRILKAEQEQEINAMNHRKTQLVKQKDIMAKEAELAKAAINARYDDQAAQYAIIAARAQNIIDEALMFQNSINGLKQVFNLFIEGVNEQRGLTGTDKAIMKLTELDIDLGGVIERAKGVQALMTTLMETSSTNRQTELTGITNEGKRKEDLRAQALQALAVERSYMNDRHQLAVGTLQSEQRMERMTQNLKKRGVDAEITALENQLIAAGVLREAEFEGFRAEADAIIRNRDLRQAALDDERDQIENVLEAISGKLQGRFKEGIDSLMQAINEGTLTMENFREGFREWLLNILGDIQQSIMDEFITKPITEFIKEGMGSLVDLFRPGGEKEAITTADLWDKIESANENLADRNEAFAAANIQQVFVTNMPGKGFSGGGTKTAPLDGGLLEDSQKSQADSTEDLSAASNQASIDVGKLGVTAVATFASVYAATGDFKEAMIATFLAMFMQIAMMQAMAAWGGASGGYAGRGGTIQRFAAGGGVFQRDRIPALLEPGEFVIRKPMAKAIGGPALQRMNAHGQMPGGNVEVNLVNKGTPQKAEAKEKPKFDGKGMVIEIVLTDLKNNGPIKQAIRGGGRR